MTAFCKLVVFDCNSTYLSLSLSLAAVWFYPVALKRWVISCMMMGTKPKAYKVYTWKIFYNKLIFTEVVLAALAHLDHLWSSKCGQAFIPHLVSEWVAFSNNEDCGKSLLYIVRLMLLSMLNVSE